MLADDSGLCVDALDGAPGVWSARYAGEHATDEMNNAKLLLELKEQRLLGDNDIASEVQGTLLSKARFLCALALYDPKRHAVLQVEAACEGYILSEARGSHGFGYDPLFYLPEFGASLAEITMEQKNQISHRAKAVQALLKEF